MAKLMLNETTLLPKLLNGSEDLVYLDEDEKIVLKYILR
jgi:hypothetical protein